MVMTATKAILTRLLPKTGQVAVYQAGDDGTYQSGWWRGRKIVDNKTRFILKTINGDDVVIDRATGLMWAADGNALGCGMGVSDLWGVCVSYAEGLEFAGFSDWRLPNIIELNSIVDWSLISPSIKEPPFANTQSIYYWSSSTKTGEIDNAWVVTFTTGYIYYKPKATSYCLRCVRGGV